MFKAYYQLTKPGIIYGNMLTATGGFLFASKSNVDTGLFFAMLGGISLVIASACVFNNYIDRRLDDKMTRTKNRALVTGQIPARNALLYAIVLGSIGGLVLALHTNVLALGIALAGFSVYVVLYGLAKRRWIYGTEVGSIAGAVPVIVGYTAVTNSFDTGALLLFLILVLWQMPHFYAIAMYRLDDYKAASIPVLPVKKGMKTTKARMLMYITGFIVATVMLAVLGYAGYVYLAVMLILGCAWLYLGSKGFKTGNDKIWARNMFRFSLLVIVIFSVMISLDALLP